MTQIDFHKMWKADKESILETMIRNMEADLHVGYKASGECIQRQVAEIAEYKVNFDKEQEALKYMTERQVQHWCKYDMIKRGAIEL